MNNKLKAIIATSSLSLIAGYASATTYSVEADVIGLIVGCSACSSNATGSGTYDDATNTLNLTVSEFGHVDFQDGTGIFDATIGRDVVFSLDVPEGFSTATSCVGNDPASQQVVCGSEANVPGNTTSLGVVNQDFSANNGPAFSLGAGENVFFTRLSTIDRQWTITVGEEISEVPVPAAAWLFGSAMLGLAGVARKRK